MNTLNKNLLITLLEFAQSDVRASVAHLAFEMHLPRRTVAGGLNALALHGLVLAETCRLTLPGLAVAASLRAKRGAEREEAARRQSDREEALQQEEQREDARRQEDRNSKAA